MKIKKPKFWDRSKLNYLSILLFPLSLITLLFNFLKSFSKKKKFKIKTICVGNIYLGGTGKTPLVIELNRKLRSEYKTVFVKKNIIIKMMNKGY